MAKNRTLSKKEWQEIYEKNKDQLMSFEGWQSIKDKSLRKELFKAWRGNFSDKQIREFWKLGYQKFYYHLKSLGLKGAGGDVEQGNSLHQNSLIDLSTTSNNPNRTVIDAEYRIVEDTINPINNTPIMQFKENGTPERIIKRLQAIVANLELEEGELGLKIEVYRLD